MPIDINQLTPQEQISSIYISYYNRAPDPLGLEFWTGQLDAGLSLEDVATTFSSAAETIGQFPFFDPDAAATSPDAFLTSVYQNLFGRDPEAEGLTFWGDQLASGSTPVGEIILAIAEGAQDVDGGTQDLSTLTNKIDVAADWAASAAAADIGTTEGSAIAVDNGDGTFTINEPEAFDSASTVLEDVDDTEQSVTAATDATDAFIADGTVPEDVAGDTVTLASDVDDISGTSSDDTINAPLGTLQSFDTVDGGDGIDTLNAQFDADGDESFSLDGTVSNIENHFFRAADSDSSSTNTLTIEAADVGADQIWADRTQANLVVNDVGAAVTAGVVQGGANSNNSGANSNNAGDPFTYTLNYAADALNDDDVTQSVALDNANIQLAIEAGGSDVITGLALDLTGENKVVLTGSDLTSADLTDVITPGTGSIDLDMTDNADADHTVTLGSGDNTLRFEGTDLDSNDSLDLGTGTDTVLLSKINTATEINELNLSGLSNDEVLGLTSPINLNASATLSIGDRDALILGSVNANAGFSLTVKTSASSLIISHDDKVGTTNAPDLVVDESVSDLTIENTVNSGTINYEFLTNESSTNDDTLETLTLSDTSEDGDGSFTIGLGDGSVPTAGLTTITLDGQAASEYVFGARNTDFDSPVTIQIDGSGADNAGDGTADVFYENDGDTVRETFQFTADNIADVTIGTEFGQFTVGASGGADRLDFSQFDAVSGLGDVAIAKNGNNVEITAVADQFDGTITLTGVSDTTAVENDGFIF